MGSVLEGQIRNAVNDYHMIKNGDRIAVGVSGGKDSMALLYALANQRRYLPVKYEIKAFTLSVGFEGFDISPIQKLCDDLDVEYEVIHTHIREVVFDIRKETNPCSLCANMRRGAINDTIKKQGYHKIALGHHKDDVIETYLMSMFYEGRLNTFSPVTYLSNQDIYSIRPLVYSYEKDIRYYVNLHQLQVVKNPCPMDGITSRQEIRDLIKKMSLENPHFKSNIFGVIKRNHLSGW